jgi:2-oxoglutarate ferredoxin oxidoreductase subunit alpha
MTNDGSLVVRVGGESGEGIVTIGDLFTRIAAYHGHWVYTFRTFPAEILGGHVVFQIRVGSEPLRAVGDEIDVVVGLNQEACQKHYDLIRDGGTFVYNADTVTVPEDHRVQRIGVPMDALAEEIGVGARAGRNVIMVGVLTAIFEMACDQAETVIRKRLGKNEELLEMNLLSLRRGYEWARENLPAAASLRLPEGAERGGDRLILTGNQAIAIGALAGGLTFFAGYPITPATDIMEFLAGTLPAAGGTLVQAEDEIASISMCVGASFSGARAMTATSGPGMALMQEMIGHASMTEIPVVIVDVQRAGPSTGMPTKTAQADLWMALYGGNDEGPRIVIAPTSVEDSYYQIIHALNMAERYQMPVILLSDQALSSRIESIPPIPLKGLPQMERLLAGPRKGGDGAYQRYAITEDGLSPMALPGTPGLQYTAEGLEHLETGAPNYAPDQHVGMMNKRWRKLETAYQEYRTLPGMFSTFGAEEPDLGVITWGTTEGPVREAIARAQAAGRKVAAFVPRVLSPLPREELRAFAEKCQTLLIPELNSRGQFARLLRSELGIEGHALSKYDGLPFFTKEIEAAINEICEAVK